MVIKYRTFKIPKRTGGFRTIEQPIGEGMEILKEKLIELEKLEYFKPSYLAHAFMHGRNIVTCAKHHFGKKYIMRIDIKDFFNSISYDNFSKFIAPRLKGEKLSDVMDKIKICFRFPEGKDSYLPQGAPTSPFLSNAYLRDFDYRVGFFCAEREVVYNRYADDIYLSTDITNNFFWSCVACIHNMLKGIGLTENKKKRKLMHASKRMNVLGIILNEKFHVGRKTRRIIRAMIHNAEKDKKALTAKQKGIISHAAMVENYQSEVIDNIKMLNSYKVLNDI